MCVVPNFTRLDSELLMRNISYTVKYGAAPGPDLRVEELTIDVRQNPFFKEDGSALSQSEFIPGVGGLLRITVSIIFMMIKMDAYHKTTLALYFSKGDNLDSVERSEISVTVGGEESEDRTSPNDDPNTVSGNNSPTITIILIFTSCSMCVKYQVSLPKD